MNYLYKLIENLNLLTKKEDVKPFGKPTGYKNVNSSSTNK